MDPRFPAGLPFPVPEILEFVAFGDSGKFSSNFPGIFPELSSRTPAKTPETATALQRASHSLLEFSEFWRPSGAPGLHALLKYFGINFRFDYTYTYTFHCFGN